MKKPEDIKNFVAEKIKEKGLALNKVSIAIGKDGTYLFQYINRNSPKRLGEVERKKLAKILDINESELIDTDLNTASIFNPQSNIVSIDVLDVSACCGNGIENFEENVIGQQMMTLPALREFTAAAPENIKIIKAIGDSMVPTIYPGDVVWVDVSFKEPASDGLYLLGVGKELMIKRIQINPFDNSATIKADNPQYETFQKGNYQEIKVVGKIIYHMKKVG